MKKFLSVFIRNTVLVNLLMVLILLMGWLASVFMVKEVLPEVSVDILQISVPYPGADPQEVEEGISLKIEEAVDGIEGIKRYRTVSAENLATGIIEIKEGYPSDKIYTDVRNAIDSISTFPLDAEKPIISELAIKEEILTLAIWGNQDERTLKEFAETIKDEIQALPNVSQISISGAREYEIAIEISEEKLRQYGLSFQQVSEAVRTGSLNLSGGTMRTKGEEIRLRTVGRKYRAEEFAEIVVVARPNGDIITLEQLATINDGFTENEIISRFNGETAVMLGIFKTPSEDTIAIVNEVKKFVATREQELPAEINMTLWSDQSVLIRGRLSLLMRNGMFGLAIVFLSLWIFLDLRLSFWVTLGIPISLSGGLFIMWMIGATINEISTFALIMVLGIVVDDAIIVGEAIYVHRRKGDGPMLAAVNGVMEVGMPVLAAVTTTILAFIPLLFVEGILGKFIINIPVAVIASLVVSLVECLFILPAHLNHLPPMTNLPETKKSVPKRLRAGVNRVIDFIIHNLYDYAIKKALHFRYITISFSIAILLSTVGLMSGGFVKFIIFPNQDTNSITARIEFPNGTPTAKTHQAVQETDAAFKRLITRLEAEAGYQIALNIHAVTGENGGEDFVRSSSSNMGYVRAELVDGQLRDITAQELLVAWEKEVGPIPGAIGQVFATQEQGPPGSDIMISLRGDDMDDLRAASAALQKVLHTYDGVNQIQDSFRPGKNELQLNIKPEARTLGLTLEILAQQVNSGYFGSEALRIQRGRDDIRVKIRYTEDERSRMSDLENMRIRTPQGIEVPFYSVAEVKYESGYASIARLNGQKNIVVSAEVDEASDSTPSEILRDINANHLPKIKEHYPNLSWLFDGPQTDARDAFAGLFKSFPVAALGIFLVIASIFRSYVQPLIILTTVPFGIIGAIYGHILFGVDLAMFSVFGMIALTGVVVNDAIVLIEAINRNIGKGARVFDAIIQGGIRRFRAILLTSISTVGGLMPLIMEKDGQAQIVIPMAISIASGVAFATVLTLFFVPCLYGVLNDLRRVAHFLKHLAIIPAIMCVKWLIFGEIPEFKNYQFYHWPTREEVEPARLRFVDPLLDDMAAEAMVAK